LSAAHPFVTAYEQHAERPFQALFKQDKKYALANQVDYMFLRAEQERELRASPAIGLMDGGLDLDFHGFTRLFLSRNLLTEPEFDLCRRVYTFIRAVLPLPELIVRLRANEITVADRMSRRNRINIAGAEDTTLFDFFLNEWLASIPSVQKLDLDVADEPLEYPRSVAAVLAKLADWSDKKPKL
jgi:deoxyadenosine/deoxycytidine kinase